MRAERLATALLILALADVLMTLAAPAHAAPATPPTTVAPPAAPVPTALGCASNPVTSITCNLVGGVVGQILNSAGEAVMKGVTTWLANGAAWLLQSVGGYIVQVTKPNLAVPWFQQQYRAAYVLSATVTLLLLLVTVVVSVIRGDVREMAKSAAVGTLVSPIAGAAAPTLIGLLVALTDWMAAALSAGMGSEGANFMASAQHWLLGLGAFGGGVATPLAVVALGAVFTGFAAFAVFVELLLRDAAVYFGAVMMPLVLAAAVLPAWRHRALRLIEALGAIVVAKVPIVAAVALGASALGAVSGSSTPAPSSASASGFAPVLLGGAFLALAAFAPFGLLRLTLAAEAVAASELRQHLRQGQTPSSPLPTPTEAAKSTILARLASAGPGRAGATAVNPAAAAVLATGAARGGGRAAGGSPPSPPPAGAPPSPPPPGAAPARTAPPGPRQKGS